MTVWLPSCAKQDKSNGRRVIVMGFDGMDPRLTEEMMQAGRLPNFSRVWEQGGFAPLQSTIPPQSPVAWSTVISGLNPGGHGIFDFIHRDPAPPEPNLPIKPIPSHAQGEEDKWVIGLFGYRIPLRPGQQKLLRYGKPFWERLTEAGIPARVFRMPANYPAQESQGAEYYCLTDMGTPDLKETSSGIFSYYTSDPTERSRRISGGGEIYPAYVKKNTVESRFYGPKNVYRARETEQKAVEVPFTLWRDPEDPVVRLTWQDQVVVLHEGEWSDWYPIAFEMVPHVFGLATAKAECRFFLKQVHPHVKLYVSPFNFDSLDENAPVSVPLGFAADVAEVTGRYYTQGLPESTKTLTHKILSRPQFLDQAELVYQERMKLLDYALERYPSGFLFFYYGGTDLIGHMFWGARTPNHPALTSEDQQRYAHEIERVYQDADRALGKVLDRCPDATILVISDHGFDTFTRGFNLNTWLLQNGYLKRLDDSAFGLALNIDFAQTRAYGLGINGLYVNLMGREKRGIVDPADKQALLDEVREKLLAVVDPKTGEKVIKEVYQCDRVYSGPYVSIGPDLQVGYNHSYRGSWDTVLGGVPAEVMVDNTDAWCADHCIATDLVPGILLANRPIRAERPSLLDIAPTILAEYGVPVPAEMEGRSVFGATVATSATP
ncbi:MAG: alkaline phosphatase family protein [Planctomycetota bacterium]